MNTKTTILTIALAAICATGYAANNNLAVTDTTQTEEILTIAQEMPVFPGGDSAMCEYITENLVYPAEAKDKNLEGKVFVQFVINKNGEVVSPRIARGIDPILDDEVLRVVRNMPKWIPGKNNGNPVNVMKTIPVNIKNNSQPDDVSENTTNPTDSIKVVLLENPETNTYDTVYIVAEEMPEYPDGDLAMRKFIARNLHYPKEALNKKIQGKVVVYYVVNEKGEIENVNVSESVHPLLDAEAIRVVKKLPKPYKPGKVHGKPVKVLLAVPAVFKIN
ncbi:MAG: energy transducer TonB [Salinivirgaceae bacterium]|nr:energy transducer TonB [Salinivirgaceae bacterium]